ncbi:DUF937 domain-containing protein [candidate division KSB1 bacterium]|nr:DUF937 domain-containing protein [candidate division KSB1 bacterium]
MASFVDEFMKSMGPEVSRQLSTQLGINKKTAAQIIPQVAPLILGGLKRQKDERGGEPRVDHILNKYGDPCVLDHIGALFADKARDENPDPRLGGLLGDSGIEAANMMSKQYRMDQSTASRLIPMLAPIVLGFLTRKRDQGGAGSSGIASLLDHDGDGSVLDDVAGFLMQGMAGGGGRRQGNVLGSLIGGLFGKRR